MARYAEAESIAAPCQGVVARPRQRQEYSSVAPTLRAPETQARYLPRQMLPIAKAFAGPEQNTAALGWHDSQILNGKTNAQKSGLDAIGSGSKTAACC